MSSYSAAGEEVANWNGTMLMKYIGAIATAPQIKAVFLSQWHLDTAKDNEVMATTGYFQFDRITEKIHQNKIGHLTTQELIDFHELYWKYRVQNQNPNLIDFLKHYPIK